MKILAADTTTSINAVALCDENGIIAETIVQAGRKHSERLLATVDWLFQEAATTLKHIDALAISVGPGSFTGLRIGVSTWKGLALGADLPLVPVPTLDAMTRLTTRQHGFICPMLDAKMNEVYSAVFQFEHGRRHKVLDEFVGPAESTFHALQDQVIFIGDGATLYRDTISRALPKAQFAPPQCNVPRGSAVAAEAIALIEQGIETDPARVSPVYLRKSQAEHARNKQPAKASTP